MSVGAVNKQTGDRIPTAGMPAIDDALDLTSVNPVQNAVITAALANKQDKTDNNLKTTSKTVVGAVNELKSGLTNVDVALSVPDGTGKNVLPMSLSDIKRCNTYGTWADNVYTYNGITFTVNLDGNGDIASIKATGTASSKADFIIADNNTPNIKAIMNGKSVTLNGCPANGSSATYSINGWQVSTTASSARDTGSGVTFNAINISSSFNFAVSIANGYEIATAGLLFYPMVRLASVSDPTFAPYIPSVESRIEALNNNLTGVFTADLLYEGAPTTAETYEEMNLISGKSITDYLLILFICRKYNNTVAFAIEPRHVFTQQTGDSSRVIFKYGDGALQAVMVYYVSPTKIAVNQKTVDGTIWKTALYGVIKQP